MTTNHQSNMTTERAIQILYDLATYSPDFAQHTDADVALDTVFQALTERDAKATPPDTDLAAFRQASWMIPVGVRLAALLPPDYTEVDGVSVPTGEWMLRLEAFLESDVPHLLDGVEQIQMAVNGLHGAVAGVELRAKLLTEENTRLRATLEPFADAADAYEHLTDEYPATTHTPFVTVGQLRAARDVLEGKG